MSTIDSGHYGDGVVRRTKRLWTDEEKRSIFFQTATPGVSVAQVARRYAVNANLIFKWLRDARFARDPAAVQSPAVGPAFRRWRSSRRRGRLAETKAEANAAFDFFIEAYGVKYDRASKRLTKDRADLLAFYDFPAEHWKHIRTPNSIESTFSTVRHRTTRTKGCLSRQTALVMTHQLTLSAKKKWRKLDGQNRPPEIIQGIEC